MFTISLQQIIRCKYGVPAFANSQPFRTKYDNYGELNIFNHAVLRFVNFISIKIQTYSLIRSFQVSYLQK